MILLVGDGQRSDVVHGIRQVEPLAREFTDNVLVDLDGQLDINSASPTLVINFGGDGSIIRAAGRLGLKQVPILGVNFGKFGFLAEFELPELLVQLQQAIEGELPTRESLLLQVRIVNEGNATERIVVNDIVLQRNPDTRMAHIEATYNDESIATYYGDGLIVSSPLGSTAYNLSSGGPLLYPHLDAICLTPMCPHTLTIRPLTLPAQGKLTLRIQDGDEITVTSDGEGTQTLRGGDTVEIERAPVPMVLVSHPTRSWFDTLRLKFHWSKRTAYMRPVS
ncbi:NAD(+)/NADH kinase [Planctomycetota bacterium]|nr:NAD(+)/NADH kinase [Planctomycetota bacterium]